MYVPKGPCILILIKLGILSVRFFTFVSWSQLFSNNFNLYTAPSIEGSPEQPDIDLFIGTFSTMLMWEK